MKGSGEGHGLWEGVAGGVGGRRAGLREVRRPFSFFSVGREIVLLADGTEGHAPEVAMRDPARRR